MTRLRMAFSATFSSFALTLPPIGQTSDDSRKESFVPPMQTQSQVSNARQTAADRQLSRRRDGSPVHGSQEYHGGHGTIQNASEQNPHNAVYLNKLGIRAAPANRFGSRADVLRARRKG